MKVEHPRLGVTVPAEKADAIDSGRTPPPAAPVGSSDSVRLSGDLRLANEAVKALQAPDGVRADRVARGRALLESGTLGADVDTLADRMLDAMTTPHDPDRA